MGQGSRVCTHLATPAFSRASHRPREQSFPVQCLAGTLPPVLGLPHRGMVKPQLSGLCCPGQGQGSAGARAGSGSPTLSTAPTLPSGPY